MTPKEGAEQARGLSADETAAAGKESTVSIDAASRECNPDNYIGPYRLVRQIGEGGMGVVYHAQQLSPIRRDVALKVIKPGMDSKRVIARFESERQALAMMDHANIARVFDAGTTASGQPYFIMELVHGLPITRYCESRRLTIRQRVELFIPICNAIQHAHQKGIVHRDIKPSNLLIEFENDKPVAKVIDFGLAKALGPSLSDDAMLTNPGTVVGTLAYMSPEQAELDRHDVDTRSDVYSLGAVLYELLTDTTPLEDEHAPKVGQFEALRRIREKDPLAPSARLLRSATIGDIAAKRQTNPAKLRKLLQGELDWIAMKALDKDRKQRYETVNGLSRDLQRYLEGEPVEASPPSATYRVRKLVRKHKLRLGTAAAVLFMVIVGGAVSAWLALRATRAETEARAISDFLQSDLLAQAGASNQAGPGTKPDPDLKVRTVLERAAVRIKDKFAAQPLVEASLRQTIGSTYRDLGLFPEAQIHVERALQLRVQELGEQHPETLTTINTLATLHRLQGKYAQAEPLFRKAVEARRRTSGDEHPDTLASMNGLGVVYILQGKSTEAKAILTGLLAARRRVLGEEHPDTLGSMNNLARVHLDLGEYAQAEGLFENTLDIRRRVSGEERPLTLTAMNNLAVAYKNRGKYAQAEPLYLRTLDIQRRVRGEHHPDTLMTLNNLADLYRDQGKYVQAGKLLKETLAIKTRVLGEEHPETVVSMGNLAALYKERGEYTDAEALLDAAIRINRRVQGDEHPDTLINKSDLAELFSRQGKYELAEGQFSSVLTSRQRVLGKTHPDTLRTLASLGKVRLRQHQYAAGEAVLLEALRAYEAGAPVTWVRYDCQGMLGALYVEQKRYGEAEPLLLTGYDGLVQWQTTIPAESRQALVEVRTSIVQLYERSGRPEKAAEWRQKPAGAR